MPQRLASSSCLRMAVGEAVDVGPTVAVIVAEGVLVGVAVDALVAVGVAVGVVCLLVLSLILGF